MNMRKLNVSITQSDIDNAQAPNTEQARLFGTPANAAIKRALVAEGDDVVWVMCAGWSYFKVRHGDGSTSNWDMNSYFIRTWNQDWDDGVSVKPIAFTAELTKVRQADGPVPAGYKPRRYGKDTETRWK